MEDETDFYGAWNTMKSHPLSRGINDLICELGMKSLLALTALCASYLVPQERSFAGVVTWQAAQSLTSDSDVDLTGTLVYAYNFGATAEVFSGVQANPVQSVTVRGVTFASFAAPPMFFDITQSITVGDVTLSETPGYLNGIDTSATTGDFLGISAPYQGLLGTGIRATIYAQMTLSLGGLETGRNYRFQFWLNDSKNDLDFNRVEVNGEGNSTEIKANISNSVGDLGQYVIGTFLATGNTQEIKFDGIPDVIGETSFYRYPLVNAFQLRLENGGEVPEPTTLAIFGFGTLGIGYRNRRKRLSVTEHR
jgi:hypothetical protein